MSHQQQHTEFAATIPPVQPTVAFPVELGHESKVSEISIKEATTEPFIALAPSGKLVLNNIDTLKIRSARKVASALGIKQKANGTDKSLKCLQQEIRQQLESDYGQVVQALQLGYFG